MRKKSPATIQKWVDSIATDDADDNNESSRPATGNSSSNISSRNNNNKFANASQSDEANKETVLDESTEPTSDDVKADNDDATTTTSKTENLKVKLNEICNKLNVNEALRSKHSELKNLIQKTSHKLKSEGDKVDAPPKQQTMETNQQQTDDKPTETSDDDRSNLTAQRARIGVLGRSSSENPKKPRNKRLSDIGRSFSVSNESESASNDDKNSSSNENFIYDVDEDISITIPSLNTSSTISNSQNLSQTQQQPPLTSRTSLLQIKPARQHTVSEGHASPIVQSKNPLLRDSSFQVCVIYRVFHSALCVTSCVINF